MLPPLSPSTSSRLMSLLLLALASIAVLIATIAPPALAADDKEFSYDFDSSDAIDSKGLEAPFIGEDLIMPAWDFGGDTLVDINNYIRLASDKKDQTGWLWSLKPIGIKFWEIDIDFRVHGKLPHYIGDGIGIWFVQDNKFSEGDALGFKSSWNGLGILIDTYDNGHNGFSYSRIAGFNNTNSFSYDKDKDGVGQDVGSCEADIYNKKFATRLRVNQSPVGVTVSLKGEEGVWKTCFQINGGQVPESYYLGFTGNTGGLSANFDIRRVRVIKHNDDGSSGVERPPVLQREQYMPSGGRRKDKDGDFRDSFDDFVNMYDEEELEDEENSLFVTHGGKLSYFSSFLLLLAVAAVGTAGYRWYRAKQERDMKRF